MSATRNSAKSCRVADSIRGSEPIYTIFKSLKLFFKKSTKTFQQALLCVYHKKFLKKIEAARPGKNSKNRTKNLSHKVYEEILKILLRLFCRMLSFL